MKKLSILCVVTLLLVVSTPALANWTGDNIFGVLNFGSFGTTNFFDPVNGGVPAGSSGIQPNAVVTDPDGSFVEFMYLDGFAALNVDVDATTLTVHEFPATPGYESTANSWDIYISGFDPDICSASIILNTIPGMTWSILCSGDKIQISYPGGDAFGPTSTPNGWQAQFCLKPCAIPAPGAILLGSIGVSLVGWMRRKRAI